MSSEFDDKDLNNLGPSGVSDAQEAETRLRLNRDIGAALEDTKFRSRRSAIMAQIRNEVPTRELNINQDIEPTPLAKLETVTPLETVSAKPNNSGSPNNVVNLGAVARVRRRGFPAWAGTLAAAIVILVVAGLILLILNNTKSATNQNLVAVSAPQVNRSSSYNAASSLATTNPDVKGLENTAPALTRAAATTMAATTNAVTTAAAMTSAAAMTTAAMTSAAVAGAIQAGPAGTTNDLTNIPNSTIESLPVYPNAAKVNFDGTAARSFILDLLLQTSGSISQNLRNNRLVLLNVYRVKAADLPQWYADHLQGQNFKLSDQNSSDASQEPANSALDWRVFTSSSDPKQSLTYFFLNIKNSTVINPLLGSNRVADGDTLIMVFGSRA